MQRVTTAAGVALLSAAAMMSATLGGAEPTQGAISSQQTALTWTGGPFTASNPAGCVGAADPTCDHFQLFVNAPNNETFMVAIQAAAGSTDDFDLYVYYPDGSEAASSTTSGNKESLVVQHRTDKGSGPYEVRVQPWLVNPGATYDGLATLHQAAPTDVTRDCLQAVPPALGVPGVTDLGQPVTLNVTVLLDGVSLARAQEQFAHAAAAYAPINVPVRATYQTVNFATNEAEALIQLAKNLFGGRRPAGSDIVYVLTNKDIQSGGNAGVAGLADCIGGVRFATRAFAVGEEYDGAESIGPFTLMNDATAKVAAHEIGHLMGGHHHYANCVEGVTSEVDQNEISPCTLMFNFVDFQSINFSTLNQAVVRGHAVQFAAP